jgi:hypothetical protein
MKGRQGCKRGPLRLSFLKQMTAKEEAMETSATRGVEYSVERVLFLAFELGTREWKLGFSTGLGQAPRIRSMPAADLGTLQEEILC